MRTTVKTFVVFGICAATAWVGIPRAMAAEGKAEPQASASKGTTQYKIAIVDRKKVFDSYEKQKAGMKELETEKAKRQAVIDKLTDSITAKKDKYKADDAKMSDDEKEKLKSDINTEYQRYQTEFKLNQQEMDQKAHKFVEQMTHDIDMAVAKIGDAEQYHLILEGDPNNNTSVIYYSTTIDITSQVIMAINGK